MTTFRNSTFDVFSTFIAICSLHSLLSLSNVERTCLYVCIGNGQTLNWTVLKRQDK